MKDTLRMIAAEELHCEQKRKTIEAIKTNLANIDKYRSEIDKLEVRIADLEAGAQPRHNDYGNGERWE